MECKIKQNRVGLKENELSWEKTFEVFLDAVSILLSCPPSEVREANLSKFDKIFLLGTLCNICETLLTQCNSEFKPNYAAYMLILRYRCHIAYGFLSQRKIEQVVRLDVYHPQEGPQIIYCLLWQKIKGTWGFNLHIHWFSICCRVFWLLFFFWSCCIQVNLWNT